MASSGDRIIPYYHPSIVVVIDDDRDFLRSFHSRFRRTLLCRVFDNPNDAIRHIETVTPRHPRYTDCISSAPVTAANTNQLVAFRPSIIRDIMHDAGRFQEVSVVVVDYDMPGTHGLEICRHLRNLPARKLMLTGAADEKLAMAAFNEGIIDRFVLKRDCDAIDRLDDIIRNLQFDYFSRLGTELTSVIKLNESAFIADPDFIRYFDLVFRREDATEYFLSENPPGILMVKADGTVQTLLVQHNVALMLYSLMGGDGPSGLRERMATETYQPWFPTASGFYSEEYRDTWQQYVHPADRIGLWYCSVIAGIAGRRTKRAVPSYHDYCRRLYTASG